jgi:hypothetical protein
MAHRSIEEVIDVIAPSRRRGIPNPATEGIGVSGAGGDLSTALSQAGQQIGQLQSEYQQQANLIAQNTQAVQNNTSAQGGHSGSSTAGHVVSSLFGGAFGFLSPVVSGILQLFGGGSPQPAALPVYTPPPPVAISGILHSATPSQSTAAPAASAQTANTSSTTYSPQITVNVSAMDSQSFLDRSSDIANAVREAMLNNHPINGVVADL